MLTVSVNSFSYKQGIPVDKSGHGGGFVFDMRFVDNPGRLPEMKLLTGRDEAVRDLLDQNEIMQAFLTQLKEMLKPVLQKYIERDFEHLMISFGCTGGQHRSVYTAEHIGNYLLAQYPVDVILSHVEQERIGNFV